MKPDSSQWYLVTLKYIKLLLDIREFGIFGKLELVDPGGCEVSILGDVKNPTEHTPGQPALVGPALSRRAGLDCPEMPSSLNCSVIL